jgi:hypothetical protein
MKAHRKGRTKVPASRRAPRRERNLHLRDIIGVLGRMTRRERHWAILHLSELEYRDDRLAELKEQDMARSGGLARAAALTPERRSEIAKKAALSRWRKPNE